MSSIYTCYMKRVRCVYDIDHMYALWIENTSESDPRSYEGFNRIRAHDLRDVGARLYQLSYEASLEAVSSIYNCYMKRVR